MAEQQQHHEPPVRNLFDGGINFNDLPLWQKRGFGMAWESYWKEGVNHLEKCGHLRSMSSRLILLVGRGKSMLTCLQNGIWSC